MIKLTSQPNLTWVWVGLSKKSITFLNMDQIELYSFNTSIKAVWSKLKISWYITQCQWSFIIF